MASFRVTFRRSVAKDLRRIPSRDAARILDRVQMLAVDPGPPGSEKLSTRERYRVRQGVYRIIYEIRDDELVIIVVKVGHRGGVYRTR